MKKFDLSLPLGIIFSFGVVIFSIFLGGGGFMLFMSLSAILTVLLCTLLIVISSFGFSEFLDVCFIAFKTSFFKPAELELVLSKIIYTSQLVKKHGFLYLQDKLEDMMEFQIFSGGIQMYIDGFSKSDVLGSAEQLSCTLEDKRLKSVELVKKAGEIAPGMGLIGTLIGLIQLLVNIKDVSAIAPTMSYALITTFYGSVFSFMFFSPLASRIEYVSSKECLLDKLFIQALSLMGDGKSSEEVRVVLNSIILRKNPDPFL